jgi:hypothetical protein
VGVVESCEDEVLLVNGRKQWGGCGMRGSSDGIKVAREAGMKEGASSHRRFEPVR